MYARCESGCLVGTFINFGDRVGCYKVVPRRFVFQQLSARVPHSGMNVAQQMAGCGASSGSIFGPVEWCRRNGRERHHWGARSEAELLR